MRLWHQVQGVASGLTTTDWQDRRGLALSGGQRGPSYAKGCADTSLSVVSGMSAGRPTSILANAMLVLTTRR